MGTLIFCTSFIPSATKWSADYAPWLAGVAMSGLDADATILVDDGSAYAPNDIVVVSADTIGQEDLPTPAIVRFATHSADPENLGWWRSFFFSLTIAEAYGLTKIVHLESDVALLSEALITHINQVSSGWVGFELPHLLPSRPKLEVICKNRFEDLRRLRATGSAPTTANALQMFRGLRRPDATFRGVALTPADTQHPVDIDFAFGAIWPANQRSRARSSAVQAEKRSRDNSPVHPTAAQRATPEDLFAADTLRDTSLPAAFSRLQELKAKFPLDGRVLARLGVAAYLLEHNDLAREALEEAVALEPANALAQKFLGASRMREGNTAGAIAAISDAVRLEPEDSGAQSMLGAFLIQDRQFERAVATLRRALELDPADAAALANIAALPWSEPGFARTFPDGHAGMIDGVRRALLEKLRKNQLTQAEAMLLLSLRVRNGDDFRDLLGLAHVIASEHQTDAQTSFNLGVIFALSGDPSRTLDYYTKATALAPESHRIANAIGYQQICAGGSAFSEGFAIANQTWPLINPNAYASDTATWQGEDLNGRHIFVYQEQGAGDAILSLRFLPRIAARGGSVVLWTRPELAPLARHAPGVARFIDAPERPDRAAHGCTLSMPLLGAITALGLGPEDIRLPTPLTLPELTHPQWGSRLEDGKLHVGLCVLGNPLRGDDWTRSVPAAFFGKFSGISGVQWVNLSVDQRDEQGLLHAAVPELVDVTRELATFGKTAALISRLDVVISIDAVVAHIAAVLGKPVLLLAPPTLDWRWQIGDDLHPWWPSVEVMRAKTPQAFGEPINRALARLREMLAERHLPA